MKRVLTTIVAAVSLSAVPAFAAGGIGKVKHMSVAGDSVFITVGNVSNIDNCPETTTGKRVRLEIDTSTEIGRAQLRMATAAYLSGQRVSARTDGDSNLAPSGNCKLRSIKIRQSDN